MVILNNGAIETCHDTWQEFTCEIDYNQNKLLLLHLNIRSLIKYHTQIEYIVTSSPVTIHIIAITEVNVTETIKPLFAIDNYVMYTELRRKRRGGGILMYVHNSITFVQTHINTINFECLFGEVVVNNTYKTYVCAIYRPPNLNSNCFISELYRLINNYPNTNCVILGDMNIDISVSNRIVSFYLDTLAELGFCSCINQFTRIESTKKSTSKTCIDHIFTRNVFMDGDNMIHAAVVRESLADHFITGLAISSAEKIISHSKTITKLDDKLVEQELASIDWNPIYELKNPNDILNYITQKFNDIYDKYTVYKCINVNKKCNCNWASDKLKQMSNTKKELFKIYLNDITNRKNELIYKKYRNKTNKLMNRAKHNYIKKEICNNFNNQKNMWKIVNRLTGRITQTVDDVLLKYFRIKTKSLCNKFAQDFEENVLNILSTCDEPLLDERTYTNTPNVSLNMTKINDEKVKVLIKNINVNKSPGYDKIRCKDIKYVANQIAPVLSHLINQCISCCIYPDKLKIGLVRPIHKKGGYKDTNNYRPITILSCIDKIIEKYFGKQINTFLSDNGIINEKQFGFQRNKSTTRLLSLFTDEINTLLNDRKHVITIMVDFSKAFDTLNYETLYKKLQQNGIQGPTLDWFKNYHFNRHNIVKIAGEHSDSIRTNHGTAQGSILAPTEFLLYVNDMFKIFKHASVYQFADDTCLITAHRDPKVAQSMMQIDFNNICKWAHDVGLSLNYQKTKAMYILSPYIKKNADVSITAHEHNCMHMKPTTCNCKQLEMVEHQKYLGLKIDSKFNWGPHVDQVCIKLRGLLAKLNILKYKLPYNALRLLYLSMADSIINYGLSSYGRTYKTYLRYIYNLQIRLLKTIVPLKIKYRYRDNYQKLFQYCKVMSVYDKIKVAIITEYRDKIPNLELRHRPSNLRNLEYLPPYKVPTCNNEYGKRVWNCVLPTTLNELPSTVVNRLENLHKNQFKTFLKRFFIHSDGDEILADCNKNQ